MRRLILSITVLTIISLAAGVNLHHAKSHASHTHTQHSPAWTALRERIQASSTMDDPLSFSMPKSLQLSKSFKSIAEASIPPAHEIHQLLVDQPSMKALPRSFKSFVQVAQDDDATDDDTTTNNEEDAVETDTNDAGTDTVSNEGDQAGTDATNTASNASTDNSAATATPAANATSAAPAPVQEEEIEEGEELPPNKIRFCTDRQCPAPVVAASVANEADATNTAEVTSTTSTTTAATTTETTEASSATATPADTTTTTTTTVETTETQEAEPTTEEAVTAETESAAEEGSETNETQETE